MVGEREAESEQRDEQRPEPQQGDESEGPVRDPAARTPMVVPIHEIRAYDRNPRRLPNPEHARIKASIMVNGMDQPLVISQRPGEPGYLVSAGGNTRLAILEELYAETGDERFARVPCVIAPWSRESDVLLAHLKENDLRGALSFIDRARAIVEARGLIEEETGERELSQRRLAEVLGERGYAVSQSLLSHLAYAVERLLPLIPEALESGLGRPQVERVRGLERAAVRLWVALGAGDEVGFETVFADLCRRYDGPGWSIDRLRRALEVEIAECADVGLNQVSVRLEDLLAGRDGEPKEPAVDALGGALPLDPEIRAVARRPARSPGRGGGGGDEADGTGDSVEDGGAGAAESPDLPRVLPPAADGREASLETGRALGRAMASDPTAVDPDTGTASSFLPFCGDRGQTDLESLRARASTLAARLAERNGIGELIVPVEGQGLGFAVRDVPDASLAQRLDEDGVARLSMLWWTLAACAETTVAPLEAVLAVVASGSTLERALASQDAGLLFESVWTLDPGHAGYRLWRTLDDQDWQDLLALMDTYRAMHRAAVESGADLWGVPP